MASIQILLATCNGEHYLSTQLDSLFAQTYTDWQILVRDDNSLDTTIAILEHYAAAHPGRIRIIRDDPHLRLGTKNNFSRLLEHADAPYVMLCDQDDRWHPDKIALTLTHMQQMEARHGAQMPLLVHTDVALCDRQLQVTAASLNHYSHMDKHDTSLARVLLKNPAWGMSMMLNRSLVQKASPVPAEDTMHDSWVTRVAALVGQIGYIDIPLVDYRVHGSNVSTIALPRSLLGRVTSRLKNGMVSALRTKQQEYHAMFENAACVSDVLLVRLGQHISANQRDVLQTCLSLPGQSPGQRIKAIHHYRLFPDSGFRKWLETCLFFAVAARQAQVWHVSEKPALKPFL